MNKFMPEATKLATITKYKLVDMLNGLSIPFACKVQFSEEADCYVDTVSYVDGYGWKTEIVFNPNGNKVNQTKVSVGQRMAQLLLEEAVAFFDNGDKDNFEANIMQIDAIGNCHVKELLCSKEIDDELQRECWIFVQSSPESFEVELLVHMTNMSQTWDEKWIPLESIDELETALRRFGFVQ